MSTLEWVAAGALAFALVFVPACWLLWRRATVADRRLIRRITKLPLRHKFALAWAMYRDPRIPTRLRLIPPALVLYLAMPIDIVPDFLPVIGQLDDLVIVLLGVALLLRFAGRDVIEELVESQEEAVRERMARQEAIPYLDPDSGNV